MNPNDQRNVIREQGRLERSEQKSENTLDFNFCKQTADFSKCKQIFWWENFKKSNVEVFCVN